MAPGSAAATSAPSTLPAAGSGPSTSSTPTATGPTPECPFVGPKAMSEGDLLFGRDHEIEDLVDLLVGRRVVLLYSPSGAGKSSLVRARLVPELRDAAGHRFRPSPLLRVNHDPSCTDAAVRDTANRYVMSILRCFEELRPEADRLPDAALARMTLASYLAERWPPEPAGKDGRRRFDLLVLDQFEEVFTLDARDRPAKAELFRQLGEAIGRTHAPAAERDDAPVRWALFVMREDHIAELDDYRDLVPTGLSTSFRLNLLARDKAAEAIDGPTDARGVTHEPGFVDKLVGDLARVRVRTADGKDAWAPGDFVEPVQLQVVGVQLWNKVIPTGRRQLLASDLAGTGSGTEVDGALQAFYDDAVRTASTASGATDRAIRDWFERELIAPNKVRGQVLYDGEAVGGGEVPASAVEALARAHLIRVERRAGRAWVELTHDRLVEPVLAGNRAWRERHLSPLQRQAALWVDGKRGEGFLLTGEDLADAERWADEHARWVGPTEREFLDACAARRGREQALAEAHARTEAALRETAEAQARAEAALRELEVAHARTETAHARAKRALRHTRWALTATVALFAIAAALTAFWGRSVIVRNQLSQAVTTSSAHEQLTAVRLKLFEAESRAATDFSQSARDALDGERLRRDGLARLDRAARPLRRGRLLTWVEQAPAFVKRLLGTAELPAALDSRQLRESLDRERTHFNATLARALRTVPRIAWQVPLAQPTSLVAFAPDAETSVTAAGDELFLWDLRRSRATPLATAPAPDVTALAYDAAAGLVATADSSAAITLWRRTPTALEPFARILAGAVHARAITALAFGAEGTLLASAGKDHVVATWDVASGTPIALLSAPGAGRAPVLALAFDGPRRRLAAVDWDGRASVWEDLPGAGGGPSAVERVLEGGRRGDVVAFYSVAFSPDGGLLAAGGHEGSVFVWSLAEGRDDAFVRLLPGEGHERPVTGVAFSPLGDALAAGGHDQAVSVWTAAAWLGGGRAAPPRTIPGFADRIHALAFAPHEIAVATDRTLVGLDATPGPSALATALPGRCAAGGDLERAGGWGPAVLASQGTRVLASCGDEVRAWTLADDGSAATVETRIRHRRLQLFASDPAGRVVVTASRSGELRLWRAGEDGAFRPSPFPPASSRVTAMALDRTGSRLAVATATALQLWRLDGDGPRRLSSRDEKGLRAVAFSPDGAFVATGGAGSPVTLWAVSDGELSPSAASPRLQEWVNAVAFAPSGHTIFSGTGKEITRWARAEQGHLERTPVHRHTDAVVAVVPGAAGTAAGPLVWADLRGRVTALLDAETARSALVLADPERDRRRAVAADDRGERVVVTGDDILVWDLRPESILRAGCRVASPAREPDADSAARDPCADLQPAPR